MYKEKEYTFVLVSYNFIVIVNTKIEYKISILFQSTIDLSVYY